MEGLGIKRGGRALEGLNPAQLAAVTAVRGPLLILAGAGSGKTRVITHRIAHLIEDHGVPPERILAITFTNKAAEEMRERVCNLLGAQTKPMWVMTFHSMCARILREHIEDLGVGRDRKFAIYDADDQNTAMKAAYKELNWDPKGLSPGAVLAAISRAKNELELSCDVVAPGAWNGQTAGGGGRGIGWGGSHGYFAERVRKAYRVYEDILRKNNAVDFDDLLVLTATLFSRRPDILERYQDRFLYIHIDEYQDTNRAQYVIARFLADKHRNICVVGDDDQSIYGWRGADIRNILEFEKDYPDAKVVKLEQNYRSTRVILDSANAVVGQIKWRKPKALWTEKEGGSPITLYAAANESDEARFVVSEIESLYGGARRFSSFAVFYRIHAQSRALEEAFVRRNIPYRIFGGVRFYQRKEIKDVLAYLRLMANPKDDISFLRAIGAPKRGIGDRTLEALKEKSLARGCSLYEAAVDWVSEKGAGRHPAGLREFVRLIEGLRSAEGPQDLASLVRRVVEESGYGSALREERSLDAETRLQNVEELISTAGQFQRQNEGAGLDDFLANVALMTDEDTYDPGADAVTLMTLHSAKGLEFPVVFVVGLEEGLFPLLRREAAEGREWREEDAELEEERRLCYVGMTRAMDMLYLTYCRERTLYGQLYPREPSRFLADIPKRQLVKLAGGPTYWGRASSGTHRW